MPQSNESQRPLRICMASAELAPLAKTGGLADVVAALAAYLHGAGHDVRVLMPFYAAIKTEGLKITPVAFIQDKPIQLGERHFTYSIDTTVLPGTEVPIYLLRCQDLYGHADIYGGADEHLKFVLLSRAAIEMCQFMGFAPDVFHCHDWHTALIPLYLKTHYAWDQLFAATKSTLTIHNIGYQGIFNASILNEMAFLALREKLYQEDLHLGRVNFLKTGLLYADLLTTVSPTYANEIQGPDYGMGLDHILRQRRGSLIGILNGVDYDQWDPEVDALIPHNFTREDTTGKRRMKRALQDEVGISAAHREDPIIGIVTRLTYQKGLDLVQKVVPDLLSRRRFSLVVLGNGEPRYEQFFHWLANRFPGRVAFYRGFNNRLAHWIEAGADMFLMPSRYEPCGLNQMYSLRYGTIPIVRETGGLADSVTLFNPTNGKGTGISFRDFNEHGLGWALRTALDLFADRRAWHNMMANAMAEDFSWQQQGQHYITAYRRLCGLDT